MKLGQEKLRAVLNDLKDEPSSATASIGDAITDVVRKTTDLKSGDVVRAVIAAKPGAKYTSVFPAPYRLRDRGRVVMRDGRYYPPDVDA